MTDPDLIRLFIEPLEHLELRYMITGGVASVIYGEPRFTRDVDVVLDLHVADVERLAAAFSGSEIYVPPPETIEEQARLPRGGHFNVIHAGTGLKADMFMAGDDPLHAWAFSRRLRAPIKAMAIWVAPVEYVILRKLQYFHMSGSDRHIRDVAMILRISGDVVERDELDAWIEKLGLRRELELAANYGFE